MVRTKRKRYRATGVRLRDLIAFISGEVGAQDVKSRRTGRALRKNCRVGASGSGSQRFRRRIEGRGETGLFVAYFSEEQQRDDQGGFRAQIVAFGRVVLIDTLQDDGMSVRLIQCGRREVRPGDVEGERGKQD
jgi:hypothetical protein